MMNASHIPIAPPSPDEFAEGYAPYINLLKDAAPGAENPAVARLEAQGAALVRWAKARNEAEALHRYAEGKWCVAQVIGHLSDVERVMAYRLLRIARGDSTPLAGFDEDAWVTNAAFESRTLLDLAEEFAAVRDCTIKMIEGFDGGAWVWRGTANGHKVSGRALLWILAGHAEHHLKALHTLYGLPEVVG